MIITERKKDEYTLLKNVSCKDGKTFSKTTNTKLSKVNEKEKNCHKEIFHVKIISMLDNFTHPLNSSYIILP